MLGPPPTRLVVSWPGVPLTSLSSPPSWPPRTIHEPSPKPVLRGFFSRFFQASRTSSGLRPSFWADSARISSSSFAARARASSNFTFDPEAWETIDAMRARTMSETLTTKGSGGGCRGSGSCAARSSRRAPARLFISILTHENSASLHPGRFSPESVLSGAGDRVQQFLQAEGLGENFDVGPLPERLLGARIRPARQEDDGDEAAFLANLADHVQAPRRRQLGIEDQDGGPVARDQGERGDAVRAGFDGKALHRQGRMEQFAKSRVVLPEEDPPDSDRRRRHTKFYAPAPMRGA